MVDLSFALLAFQLRLIRFTNYIKTKLFKIDLYIYLSGFLLAAMFEVMANFTLLRLYDGDGLLEDGSRLTDRRNEGLVSTEEASTT